MERHLNNEDILKWGNFNQNQIFFTQRWIELLNVHTHSKYAVRYLNTHQALKELNYVCKEMIEGNIKRNDSHLFIVFEEVKKVISEDEVFKGNANSYFRILENSLQRSPKAENVSKVYSETRGRTSCFFRFAKRRKRKNRPHASQNLLIQFLQYLYSLSLAQVLIISLKIF